MQQYMGDPRRLIINNVETGRIRVGPVSGSYRLEEDVPKDVGDSRRENMQTSPFMGKGVLHYILKQPEI
jgi:hypothetical protein